MDEFTIVHVVDREHEIVIRVVLATDIELQDFTDFLVFQRGFDVAITVGDVPERNTNELAMARQLLTDFAIFQRKKFH